MNEKDQNAPAGPPGGVNPHNFALWDYSIRVPLAKKTKFRRKLKKWKKTANKKLKPMPVYLRVGKIYEVLIGPDAGSIEVRWKIKDLKVLEDPQTRPVIAEFDEHIREYLDANFSVAGRILGRMA